MIKIKDKPVEKTLIKKMEPGTINPLHRNLASVYNNYYCPAKIKKVADEMASYL